MFNIIPKELIWEIFLFLEIKDIFNCLLVCKEFYNINENENFWNLIAIKYNNFFDKKKLITKKKLKDFVWNVKEIFKYDVQWISVFKYPKYLFEKKEYFGFFIKNHGYVWIIQHASNQLKNDKEVVLEAVKQDNSVLKYVSERLKNEKEVVLEAVKQDGCVLQYLSERLKNDKEVVLEAVKQQGYALKYTSERLKNDKEVVLEAINQNVFALKYASKRLENDKELVFLALKKEVSLESLMEYLTF